MTYQTIITEMTRSMDTYASNAWCELNKHERMVYARPALIGEMTVDEAVRHFIACELNDRTPNEW